ncbi:MAG: ribosome small subunit-dependent GTPase A [Candidatus Latescibacteria bacterium]|jgi:ribosome biogenesis GTPase / thiamine phosphate phosphatase|nr:ribosome small subunit-dependent GTPase A [Candidatus Latescibacterota bacterium]
MELKDLGFSNWFKEKLSESQYSDDTLNLARVVSVNKDNYRIRNEEAEIQAEITGKIMYGAESNLAFPTVGDWVHIQYFNEDTFAIIHEILPRKSLLKRKTAGKKIEYQLIASNIDIAFIVQSLDFNFNLRRLERYLIMVNESNIQPVLLLSKRDLISPENLKQKMLEIKSMNLDCGIFAFSNKTGEGLDEIQEFIKPGQTYCLLGSSGVGKTTLLNSLLGQNIFATSNVREKDGKGRHKTARRQLTILDQGGLIIDTPGMRELGNIGVDTGLNETFKDIVTLTQNCRFNNCKHISEPGCSVLEAVEKGELNAKRYQNYLKIRKESEYYEMSYLEKRKKDKKFGKMIKTYMKNKKST